MEGIPTNGESCLSLGKKMNLSNKGNKDYSEKNHNPYLYNVYETNGYDKEYLPLGFHSKEYVDYVSASYTPSSIMVDNEKGITLEVRDLYKS